MPPTRPIRREPCGSSSRATYHPRCRSLRDSAGGGHNQRLVRIIPDKYTDGIIAYQRIGERTFRLATGQQHFLRQHRSTNRIDRRPVDASRAARRVAGIPLQGAALRSRRAGLTRVHQRSRNARLLLRNGASLPVRRVGAVVARRWRRASGCGCADVSTAV